MTAAPLTFLPPRRFIAILSLAAIILIFLCFSNIRTSKPLSEVSSIWNPANKEQNQHTNQKSPTVAIVVPSLSNEDTTWLQSSFPEWEKYIYTVDDANADLTVPENKGRESMTYLTYIIDHYSNLSDISIFHHADRYQWHNDDPDYDGLRLLAKLRLQYVLDKGYHNLRCVWKLGCPPGGLHINPDNDTYRKRYESDSSRGLGRSQAESNDSKSPSLKSSNISSSVPNPIPSHPSLTVPRPHDQTIKRQNAYKAFTELFPHMAVPQLTQAPCCAQFAVTAATIRHRSRDEYIHYREWLLKTDDDEGVARLMENFWHIIFGRPVIDCPNAPECYCKLYGLCDLECENERSCASQWQAPKPRPL